MFHYISDIAENAVFAGQSVGASCLVFRDGCELYSGCFGFADREKNIPMSRDTICRLFSLSKPVTAAAAMILSDRGLLSPDDPVSRYFPEYSKLRYIDSKGHIVPFEGELRISHLLTMTSGIPYANNGNPSVEAAARLFDKIIEGQSSGCELTTEEFTRRAADIPLSFEPGKKWDYGISADILGGIIEKIAGMRYSDFLRENIFAPLGMNDTGFFIPPEKTDRFAALYSWSDKGLVRDNSRYLGLTDYLVPPAFESGGAGLVSTISDYSKFARMLAGSGKYEGKRIISEKAFRYMTSPLLTPQQRACLWERLSGYDYGCFMRVMTDVDASRIKTCNGEFGWDGWVGTYFCADAENHIAVLYFTQVCGAGTTAQAAEISSLVYGKLLRNE